MEDAIAAAIRAVDDEADLLAALRAIKIHFAAGRSTSADRQNYRLLWTALTLRRSAAHGPYLPPAVDTLLDQRAELEHSIQELARAAITAAFPEGETETAASH